MIEQVLSSDPATENESKEISKIRKGKAGDKKLELAYPYVPSSLKVDGHNPVKMLYEHLSIGIHALDEEQCSETAQQISECLIFIISELNRITTSRDRFATSIKVLGTKGLPKPKASRRPGHA